MTRDRVLAASCCFSLSVSKLIAYCWSMVVSMMDARLDAAEVRGTEYGIPGSSECHIGSGSLCRHGLCLDGSGVSARDWHGFERT